MTFVVDSPADGGWQERPPSWTKFMAAAMAVGALMGAGLWLWLALRLTFFSPLQ